VTIYGRHLGLIWDLERRGRWKTKASEREGEERERESLAAQDLSMAMGGNSKAAIDRRSRGVQISLLCCCCNNRLLLVSE
jgi:hypothetical protein